MDLTDYRHKIDEIDGRLLELLEERFDVSAGIAFWKEAQGLPVLDAGREAEKLAAVEARCRPETGKLIADIFAAVMAASRAYQTRLREERHG